MNSLIDPIRYPIGLYYPQPFSEELKVQWLFDIRTFPHELRSAVKGLTKQQLQTPYKEGGWNISQIVHHIADANMNGYIRYKLGYTEAEPLVPAFLEEKWACTPEVEDLPVDVSIQLLETLHVRWSAFLSRLKPSDWERKVIHPDYAEKLSFWRMLGLYSWHPRHHAAQIVACRKRMGW